MEKNIIDDEYVNVGRQVQFDYLKFFSILFMILIHVFEDLSIYYYGVDAGLFGIVLQFLAGPLAAPMFMFALGLGISYSRHNSPKELFKRGIKLFIFAYILNFIRDGIRDLLLFTVQGEIDIELLISDVFYVDILHFAGLSFMLIALFKKLNIKNGVVVIISLLMQAIGYALIPYTSFDNNFLTYSLGLFVYTCDVSCFPLTLWFVYPAIGMACGDLLRRTFDEDKWYIRIMCTSIVILISIIALLRTNDISPTIIYTLDNNMHYKQNLLSLVFNLCVCGFFAGVFYYFSKTKLSDRIESKITYVASNLNEIYINQWILVGLFAYLTEFGVIELIEYVYVIPLGLVIWILSILLVKYTKVFTDKFLN